MLNLASRALAVSLFSVAALGALSLSAQAQVVHGFNVGVHGQGTFFDIEQEEVAFGGGGVWYYDGDIDGVGGGVSAGLDVPLGNGPLGIGPLFIGIVGDVTWGDWEGDVVRGGTVEGNYDIEYIVSLLGRAGIEVTDTTSIYGLIGWSNARIEYTSFASSGGGPARVNFSVDGITFGAGGQMVVLGGLFIFVEYQHTIFADEDLADLGNNYTTDLDANTVKAGIKIPIN